MKRLFLLLALVGMIATSCEDSGIEEPSAICADNEIKYTTKYGYPIELNKEEGFGGTLMSHTYEGEYGVLAFDNDVKCIPVGAFKDCDTITSIILPESLESIKSYAFNNCSALTSITIPDSVTTIGDYAFWDCDSLTSVYCKATTPPSLGYNVFDYNHSSRKIYVPAESVQAYRRAGGWMVYAFDIVGYDFNNGVVVE